MDIEEWEKEVQDVCYKNDIDLSLELHGVWIVTARDKISNITYSTGMAKIHSLPKVLSIPFSDNVIWNKH